MKKRQQSGPVTNYTPCLPGIESRKKIKSNATSGTNFVWGFRSQNNKIHFSVFKKNDKTYQVTNFSKIGNTRRIQSMSKKDYQTFKKTIQPIIKSYDKIFHK